VLEESLRQLARTAPLDARPWIRLGDVRREWYFDSAAGDEKLLRSACEAYRIALSLDPLDLHPRLILARLLVLLGELEPAEIELHRILEIEASHPPALYWLGEIEERRGNFLAARERYAAAIRAFQDAGKRLYSGRYGDVPYLHAIVDPFDFDLCQHKLDTLPR
jgi:tetratricopeptide (TPR) repeat protein